MFVNPIYPGKSSKTSFVSPGKPWNLIFASPGKSWKTVFTVCTNPGVYEPWCVLYVRHWSRCQTYQRLSRWWTTIRTCRQGSAHSPSMSSFLCMIDSRSVATSTSEAVFLPWLNAFCDVIAKENLKAGFPCLPESARIFFWILKDLESPRK